LEQLVVHLRGGARVDHRRWGALEEVQLDTRRDPHPVSCAVGGHQGREQPGRRGWPLCSVELAGRGEPARITPEGAEQQLHGDDEHQSSSAEGQVARMASVWSAWGASTIGSRPHPSSGTPTAAARSRAAATRACASATVGSSTGARSPGSTHAAVVRVGTRSAPERSANPRPKAATCPRRPIAAMSARAAASASGDEPSPSETWRSCAVERLAVWETREKEMPAGAASLSFMNGTWPWPISESLSVLPPSIFALPISHAA